MQQAQAQDVSDASDIPKTKLVESSDDLDFELPFSWRTQSAEPRRHFGSSDSGFVGSRVESQSHFNRHTEKVNAVSVMANAKGGRGFSVSSDTSSEEEAAGLVDLGAKRHTSTYDHRRDGSDGLLTSAGNTTSTHHKIEQRFSHMVPESSTHSPKELLPAPQDMDNIDWYHFNISRHVAESMLISTGEDGSYLLRDSSSKPGEFTLSVRAKHTVKHFPVRWDSKEFSFGFGRFSNVKDLQDHFASKPVIGGQSGVLTVLKFPYPRCVDEPETYDMIRVHAEWGSASQQKDVQSAPTFAIASKEGYMTKLGQHRKNWKTRWFVLLKNDFSYYKTREESHPIRTIDLRDVLDVSADDSQGQQNCIKVITSYRTFFMYASSAQEAEEWIKILRWKLDHPSGTEDTLKHC